jgi:hypothetical protein
VPRPLVPQSRQRPPIAPATMTRSLPPDAPPSRPRLP